MSGTGSSEETCTQKTVNHVAVKAPPFYQKNPDVWFLQMESQFQLAKITDPKTKYNHVLSTLPEDVACNLTITANTNYEDLKEEILKSLKANKHLLIDKALSVVELGDKRPSQLVNDIKRRFLDISITPDDNIIKSRLLSALPHHIRSALVGHDSVPLDQYAAIADSMLAVAAKPVQSFIGAVDSNNSNSHNFNSNRNFSSNNNSNYNDRRNSHKKTFGPRPYYEGQRPRVCNPHIYWGSRSKHCRPWCEWPNKPKHILRDNEKTPHNSRPSSPSN